MEIDINDLASIGAIADTEPFQLPPEAWTTALNTRCLDGDISSLLGWEQIFGTPGAAPHMAVPVSTNSANFWLYASLTKIFGYDGTTHTEVTRSSGGAYTAGATENWNYTVLGGIPILNSGSDVPQYWPTIALATPMANLTNWPSTLRAKVVRSFGPFLIAGNITDSSVQYPHLIQWSHPADPGAVPASWDYTDPTNDAGRKDLSDTNAGVLLDMQPLASAMYLYKENSVWRMTYVGGRFIWDFGQSAWLPSTGLLAARCVAITGDGQRHVLATQDDIIWHNGNTVKSVLSGRQRRRLFNEIDTENFHTSFMFDNPIYREMWFCYPSSGMSYPDKALILNYSNPENFVITEVDGITFRNAVSGSIESPNEELWSDGTDTWEEDTGAWSELLRRRVVLSSPSDTKLYNLDKTSTRDGAAFTVTLQREGLALLGKKRNGDWIVDHQRVKMACRLWPKLTGGPIRIRLGAQQLVDGPIAWGEYVVFDPLTSITADVPPISGRAVAIEFSTVNAVSWKLSGYKYDVVPLGQF